MPFTVQSLSGQVFYRATALKHHATALASIGARKVSGRFNRHGNSAIYLSFEPETALAEYWGSDMRPAVVAPIEFSSERLVDLTVDISTLSSDWQNWQCDWKLAQESFDNGNLTADCESWRCFDDIVLRKLNGIIYPSTKRPGGTNLVFFPEHAVVGTSKHSVIDPHGDIASMNPAILT